MEEYEPIICINCKKDLDLNNDPSDYRYCPYCGRKLFGEINATEIHLNKDIETTVYEWLAKTLSIDRWLVSETIRNQMATVFLLIWPILENKIFKNSMSHEQINRIAESILGKIPKRELDEISSHFHKRYQDRRKYLKLINEQRYNWGKIERIIEKPFYRVREDEKIVLMIFVTYRYRNNIFHGIKSIQQWNNFSNEIQQCIRFMLLLGDSYGIDKKG